MKPASAKARRGEARRRSGLRQACVPAISQHTETFNRRRVLKYEHFRYNPSMGGRYYYRGFRNLF